jgi:E3 ubiquitin-protein ligase HUWE1
MGCSSCRHRLRLVAAPQALGSGVEREWLELCARELATCGLLAPTSDGGRSLAPRPGKLGGVDTARFEALGVLLAYVLVHGRVIPLSLEAPFLRALLGRRTAWSVADLEGVDPVYARSLRVVLEADDVVSLGITWTRDEGGGDQEVTASNRVAFVQAAVAWRLEGRIAEASSAVRKGLHSVMPRDWLAILTEHDLSLLLAGIPHLDVADWRAHSRLSGFEKDSVVPGWFWQCVQAMSTEDRGLLLSFATGSSSAPPGGFAQLQGLHAMSPFTLQAMTGKSAESLPTASTCFNTVNVPPYTSYGQLERKLLAAIRFGSAGFEFV